MQRKDLWIAVLVVTIWGANFTVIRLGLDGIPPLLLATFRFSLAAIPAVFFVRRPRVHPVYWISYGATVGAGQFGFLFYAMHIGMPAGIASVVLQAQVFFTVVFAALILQERITRANLGGMVLAFTGLYLLSAGHHNGSQATVSLAAFGLTLIAAAFWGLSNIIVRCASAAATTAGQHLDMLSLVVWSSLIPPLPLLLLHQLITEASAPSWQLSSLNLSSLLSVLYLAWAATLFGYGAWSRLLSRYPATQVAPLSLLVPLSGLLTAAIVLSERLSWRDGLACSLILLGLTISMRFPYRRR